MGSRATAAVVIVALAVGVGVGIAASRHDKQRKGAGLLVAQPMSACADAVLADFFDNQRVDRLYPVHCYREALAGLPPELVNYTNASTAIQRALFDATHSHSSELTKRSYSSDPTSVTAATLRAGDTITLPASRARPGDWISCVKQGNRVRARVPPPERGVGLSADGLTYSATLVVTTSKTGRVLARCR
jgi:hypothetical protein